MFSPYSSDTCRKYTIILCMGTRLLFVVFGILTLATRTYNIIIYNEYETRRCKHTRILIRDEINTP